LKWQMVDALAIPVDVAEDDRSALAELLSREENGAGGKGDTLPEDWFAAKDAAYLKKHLIPENEFSGVKRT